MRIEEAILALTRAISGSSTAYLEVSGVVHSDSSEKWRAEAKHETGTVERVHSCPGRHVALSTLHSALVEKANARQTEAIAKLTALSVALSESKRGEDSDE